MVATKHALKPTPYSKYDIDRLLTTWQFYPGKWIGRRGWRSLTSIEREEQLGDGHHRDRKILLQTVLQLLRPHGVNLDKLLDKLTHLRAQASDNKVNRAKVLHSREHLTGPLLVHRNKLVRAYKAYREFYLSCFGPLPAMRPDSFIYRLDQLLGDLSEEKRLRKTFKHGRPVDPIRPSARKAIRAAGVPLGLRGWRNKFHEAGCHANPRNIPDALLMAVGLIEFRYPSYPPS